MAIPVILHLFNRKSTRSTEWGAMQFLADSVATRTSRIQLEDALLMATRCLLVGCIALALARPFVPPGSTIPYFIVLPALLISIALFAVATALWENKQARSWLLLAACSTLALTAITIAYESYLNLRRLGGGALDIALIIDASTSMTARPDDAAQSNFDRALDEARDIILKSDNSAAFSLILAGPSAELLTPTPSTDREALNEIINTLEASEGNADAPSAIATATTTLANGQQDGKQIIILTDAQDNGWATAANPDNHQLVIRELPTPKNFRNLAVTGISLSRGVIGVDRAVTISATVENTGTQAATPKAVQLRIGDQILTDTSLGQLPARSKTTTTFKHHFRKPGAQVLTAVADLQDDLTADNSFSIVLPVLDRISVMVIDGHPATEFFDRASAFIELALAPGIAGKRTHLIEPTIVPAQQILSVRSFDTYDAVILADVPRLPAPIAKLLSEYAARGGGLLIAPGERAQPEFYNQWSTTPARLGDFIKTPTKPDPASFNHPALQKIATTDIPTSTLTGYWQLDTTSNPFLIIEGNIAMTSCSLDTRSGNLPTRDGFLPFLHELIYHIATPESLQLNLPASSDLALTLFQNPVPDENLDTFTTTDPRGQLRDAELVNTPTGTIAKVSGQTIAGLYEIEIPEPARDLFSNKLSPTGTLPFTVTRPAKESHLTQQKRPDTSQILRPTSTEEIHTILAGQNYGQELWKILATAALILLVLEIALTNWISKNRKTNQQLA